MEKKFTSPLAPAAETKKYQYQCVCFVLVNQPTVHSGGVCRGGPMAESVCVGDI